MLDTNQIKERLSTEDVIGFVIKALGSQENQWDSEGNPIFTTVCHGGKSYKLYYYIESKSFHCYTHCGDSFDIFELTQRAKEFQTFMEAYWFVVNFFGLQNEEHRGFGNNEESELTSDWDLFKSFDFYEKIKEQYNSKKPLPVVEENMLEYFSNLIPIEWEREGISAQVMKQFGIREDTSLSKIIIPHRTKDGILRGIRGRTFNPIEVSDGKKYMPVYIEKDCYAHPLGENLYGLYENQEAIRRIKKIIVYESEKAVLMNNTIYPGNSFAVATCGSNLTTEQIKLILDSGAKEVILAYDRENPIRTYISEDEENIKKYEDKLLKLVQPLAKFLTVNVLFDYEGVLEYKMSPIDKGQETLEYLMHKKISIDCIEKNIKKGRNKNGY